MLGALSAHARRRRLTWRTWRRLAGSFVDEQLRVRGWLDAPECTYLTNYWLTHNGADRVFANAKDWMEADGRGYVVHGASPVSLLEVGDVAVLIGNDVSPWGHVAVVLDGSGSDLVTFDQNWPEGSPVNLVRHSRADVAGFLRLR